jgi:hypothetical protein
LKLIGENYGRQSDFSNKLYYIKSKLQHQMNKITAGTQLPNPNSIGDFSAYLFAWVDSKNLPCLSYIAVVDSLEINLSSIKIYEKTGGPYIVLRDKVSENYLKQNNIDLNLSVFQEFKDLISTLYT